MIEQMITVASVASLALEGLKWLVRRYIVEDMNWEFPLKFYAALLPIMQIIVSPFLIYFGVAEDAFQFGSVAEFIQTLVRVGVQSAISIVFYGQVISPLKNAARVRELDSDVDFEIHEVQNVG